MKRQKLERDALAKTTCAQVWQWSSTIFSKMHTALWEKGKCPLATSGGGDKSVNAIGMSVRWGR